MATKREADLTDLEQQERLRRVRAERARLEAAETGPAASGGVAASPDVEGLNRRFARVDPDTGQGQGIALRMGGRKPGSGFGSEVSGVAGHTWDRRAGRLRRTGTAGDEGGGPGGALPGGGAFPDVLAGPDVPGHLAGLAAAPAPGSDLSSAGLAGVGVASSPGRAREHMGGQGSGILQDRLRDQHGPAGQSGAFRERAMERGVLPHADEHLEALGVSRGDMAGRRARQLAGDTTAPVQARRRAWDGVGQIQGEERSRRQDAERSAAREMAMEAVQGQAAAEQAAAAEQERREREKHGVGVAKDLASLAPESQAALVEAGVVQAPGALPMRGVEPAGVAREPEPIARHAAAPDLRVVEAVQANFGPDWERTMSGADMVRLLEHEGFKVSGWRSRTKEANARQMLRDMYGAQGESVERDRGRRLPGAGADSAHGGRSAGAAAAPGRDAAADVESMARGQVERWKAAFEAQGKTPPPDEVLMARALEAGGAAVPGGGPSPEGRARKNTRPQPRRAPRDPASSRGRRMSGQTG